MSLSPTLLAEAAQFVRQRWPEFQARAAIICGSGWSAVLEAAEVVDQIAYADIPGFGAPQVKGHDGTLAACHLDGNAFLVFQGRRHFYEGEGWTPVAVPIAITKGMGIPELLLTNSAGCINPDFHPGDLMIIDDHINLMGDNPLVGSTLEGWGPRFPDQSSVYATDGIERLRKAAERAGLVLHEGIYLATRGPFYETPAEIRMFRGLGADAVGMSTVPEAALASAAGLRVSAVSCMTNYAAGILDQPLSHEEVTDTTRMTMPKMQALLNEWLRGLG